MPVSSAYRIHGRASGTATRAMNHGSIQKLAMDDMMDRSLNFLDSQVMMRRLTANRNCPGMAKRLASKTEKPICRRMKERYVLTGDGGM